MTKRGVIAYHTRPLPFGGQYISYSWEGGDVIEISYPLIRDMSDGVMDTRDPRIGSVFRLGPFWLRMLDHDFARDAITAIRERPIKAQAYYMFYRATRTLDRIYRLLIITLYVWGLARYDRARVPTWRDIKCTDRLAAWVDRRWYARMRRRIAKLNERF